MRDFWSILILLLVRLFHHLQVSEVSVLVSSLPSASSPQMLCVSSESEQIFKTLCLFTRR